MTSNPISRPLIGMHAPGWLDQFQESIRDLSNAWPDVNVFALLDCVFAERCATLIRKLHLPSRILYDLSDAPSPELQSVSPTLIPLTQASAAAWRKILQATDGVPMLSVIATPESLDELACRLHPWCVVKADGIPSVLRFPDTRLLPSVVKALTPEQHGAFFGPARTWRYRTRAAQWDDLPLPAIPLPPAEAVKLDEDQCVQLLTKSEPDEIIAHLQVYEPESIRRHHPQAAYDLIAFGLQRADYYGVENSDRINWCRLFIEQPELESMPEAKPLLRELAERKCVFKDMALRLTQLALGHAQKAYVG